MEVDTITVEAEARLRQRKPLVFLNACETGREGAVLTTAWGGWPTYFFGLVQAPSWVRRGGAR